MSEPGHRQLEHLSLGRIRQRVLSQFWLGFAGPWDILTQKQAVCLWGQSCEGLGWCHITRLSHRLSPSQRRDQLPVASGQRHPGDIFQGSPGGRSCYEVVTPFNDPVPVFIAHWVRPENLVSHKETRATFNRSWGWIWNIPSINAKAPCKIAPTSWWHICASQIPLYLCLDTEIGGFYRPSYRCPFTILRIPSYLHVFISLLTTQHSSSHHPKSHIVNKLTFVSTTWVKAEISNRLNGFLTNQIRQRSSWWCWKCWNIR